VNVPVVDREAIDEEDFQAVVRVAGPPLAALLRVLWEAGLRYAEAVTLRRSDVDHGDASSAARIVSRAKVVPKTKHSTRTVPITADLAKALLGLIGEPDGCVFPCPKTRESHYMRHRLTKRRSEQASGGSASTTSAAPSPTGCGGRA